MSDEESDESNELLALDDLIGDSEDDGDTVLTLDEDGSGDE